MSFSFSLELFVIVFWFLCWLIYDDSDSSLTFQTVPAFVPGDAYVDESLDYDLWFFDDFIADDTETITADSIETARSVDEVEASKNLSNTYEVKFNLYNSRQYKKSELLSLCNERRLDVETGATKADIARLLAAQDFQRVVR